MQNTSSEASRSGGSFNIIHIQSAVKVDIFVAADDPLDRERLRRRQPVTVNASDKPVTVYVDTPEDTILRKLEWYRRGNEVSERQWRDVLAVLSVQPELDKTYLDAWARRLRIADLMAKAIAETSK